MLPHNFFKPNRWLFNYLNHCISDVGQLDNQTISSIVLFSLFCPFVIFVAGLVVIDIIAHDQTLNGEEDLIEVGFHRAPDLAI